MSALTDWLLEQIAADERDARKRIQFGEDWSNGGRFEAPTPRRVIEQAEVLSQMVVHLSRDAALCPADDWPDSYDLPVMAMADTARFYLRELARIYADRPGYAEAIQ